MQTDNPGRLAVRPALPADLPFWKSVITATGLFPPELLDEMSAPFFASPDDAFWLTLEDGAPCGLAYCAPERMTDGTWNLLLIAVDPSRQGQGGGAALLAAVEDIAGQRGGRVLLVETSGSAGFEQTRGFYLRGTFVEEARIRDFYQEGEDKLVFWKRITGRR